MDFASLMTSQISKAKSSVPSDSKSKYVKRSQVEAQREAAYEAEQARLEQEREEGAAKKRKLDDEEAEKNREREEKKRRLAEESKVRREEEEARNERMRRKRLGLPELPDPKQQQDEKAETSPLAAEADIPDPELVSKLRALHEPATLFGESHRSRLRRYRKLTSAATSTSTAGPSLTTGPIPTTLEPVTETETQLPEIIPAANTPERHFLHRQLSTYFSLLLTEWSLTLPKNPPPTILSSSSSRSQIHSQTVQNLTPLIRKLESNTLPDSLLVPICAILRDAQLRRYLSANDRYLKLSIGKAAWPIGVTMVGIHERSAREKLHETGANTDKRAHIMSDEATRKFLQAVKRCLTFAQGRWPPPDLGQMMG